jgi:hypothetical protein
VCHFENGFAVAQLDIARIFSNAIRMSESVFRVTTELSTSSTVRSSPTRVEYS